VVFWVLLINALLIVAMIALVTWQFPRPVKAWRAKVPGARCISASSPCSA
jgi:hypothetical protein